MTVPGWLDELTTIVVIVVLVYLVTLLVRRAILSLRGGLFDCALRPLGGKKWRLGLARYSGELLEWYQVWHPLPTPSRVFVRENCELAGLRDSDPSESKLGYATARIIDLKVRDNPPAQMQLALNEGSAMGLVSWLESAPPGRVGYRRSML